MELRDIVPMRSRKKSDIRKAQPSLLILRKDLLTTIAIFAALLFTVSITSAQFSDSISLKHIPQNLDERVFFNINHCGDSAHWLDAPMKFVTNTAFIPVIGVPIGLYTVGKINNDHETAVAGFTIGAGLASSILLGEVILKNIIQRERPYHDIADTRLITDGAQGFSFPSGHASSSFGIATGLSLHFPKWYVIAPSFLYAILTSLSRPYLGAHYPTDILAGAILGTLMQVLWKELEKKYEDKWSIFPKRSTISDNPVRISFTIRLN